MPISRHGLYGFVGNVRILATQAQKRVGDQFAEYVRGELRRQHETGRNIYGKRFPKPKDGGAPMLDTGLLMDGYDVAVLEGGRKVRVRQHVYYSHFLNDDGAHQHLPGQVLPAKWQAKLEKIKAAEMKRFFRECKATLRLKGKAPR
jgi:hypothetical protein